MKGDTFLQKFLSYTEIKTKIIGVITFLFAFSYLFYIKQQINWVITMVFFGSMLLFDLAITALNNYIDTKTNHQTLVFKKITGQGNNLLGINNQFHNYYVCKYDCYILKRYSTGVVLI